MSDMRVSKVIISNEGIFTLGGQNFPYLNKNGEWYRFNVFSRTIHTGEHEVFSTDDLNTIPDGSEVSVEAVIYWTNTIIEPNKRIIWDSSSPYTATFVVSGHTWNPKSELQ